MASKKTIINSYWADRFLLIEELSKRSADEVILELRREYTRTLHDLNRELLYWYERLSLNNGLTGGEAILQARKLLTADELKEFKWTVEEYVKHASDKELSVRFAKEVENASVRAHISRIDALKTQITMHTNYLAAVEVATLSKLMGDVYTDSFYRVAFEMQKMAGYFTPFATLDVYAVKQAIEKPWYADGLTFSDRIWKNQAALRLRLNSDLTQNIIRGQAPDKLITQITKEFGVTRYQAARLIYTERAAAMSRANYDCYRELGVEEYEILATLDNKTSEICQDMDGEHFRIADYNIGTTAPPFHPNCRSTTMPYFGELKGGERIARDADGNNYFVPGDMKYKEWKEKYVQDAERIKFTNADKYGTIKIDGEDHILKSSRQHYLKHVEGTKQFEQYLAANLKKGVRPQSIISINENEAQKVIRKYAGTGFLEGNKERVVLDKVIGKYHNGQEYVETKHIKIHYGKKAAHIVPVSPKGFKK